MLEGPSLYLFALFSPDLTTETMQIFRLFVSTGPLSSF